MKAIIHYGTGTTRIGKIFVAMSDRGLCALRICRDGAGEARAAREVRDRRPQAHLVADQRKVMPIIRQVNELLAGRRSRLDVSLDPAGTSFQKEVWQVLQKVPRGKTCSYSELARRVGRPRAVRAVASACARNPLAIVVPCHRILRQDGGLGGYRWGTACKRQLLRWEGRDNN